MFVWPRGKTEWLTLSCWVLASFGSLFFEDLHSILGLGTANIIDVLLGSVLLAMLQWRILRHFLQRASGWLIGTIAGFSIVEVGGAVLIALLVVLWSVLVGGDIQEASQQVGKQISEWNRDGSVGQGLFIVIFGGVGPAGLAAGQSLFLRRKLRFARRWILANFIAGMVVGFIIVLAKLGSPGGYVETMWTNITILTAAAITGDALVGLLRQRIPSAAEAVQSPNPPLGAERSDA